ncbi:MAG: hypothetical protein SGI77_12810, partial [Pirellulaceae bacterium]|nr:hypothetical protein [Pirellulaceae bacterium]
VRTTNFIPIHQYFFDGSEHVDPLKEANAQAARLSLLQMDHRFRCELFCRPLFLPSETVQYQRRFSAGDIQPNCATTLRTDNQIGLPPDRISLEPFCVALRNL